MVETDHNQPVHCNGIAYYLGYKIKAPYVRKTEMEKSLYGYYMGYMCY